MRVDVDGVRCDGNGLCVQQCPELFRFREGSKKAAPRVSKVPERLQDECVQVAKSCPTGAIFVFDKSTGLPTL